MKKKRIITLVFALAILFASPFLAKLFAAEEVRIKCYCVPGYEECRANGSSEIKCAVAHGGQTCDIWDLTCSEH